MTRSDTRHDPWLAKCEKCNWYELCNKAPLKAHQLARRHARRAKEHRVCVMNLRTLTVDKTYHFPHQNSLPVEPPF